jgi:hypothetical protein
MNRTSNVVLVSECVDPPHLRAVVGDAWRGLLWSPQELLKFFLRPHPGRDGRHHGPPHLVQFGPYWFDGARGQLWRHTQVIKLPPKALAVLGCLVHLAAYLAQQAGGEAHASEAVAAQVAAVADTIPAGVQQLIELLCGGPRGRLPVLCRLDLVVSSWLSRSSAPENLPGPDPGAGLVPPL